MGLSYLKRAKKIISSQFVVTSFGSLTPLLVGMFIQRDIGEEYATTYNITDKYIHFFIIPLISLKTGGVSWLIEKSKEANSSLYDNSFLFLLGTYTLIPSLGYFFLPDSVFSMLVGIDDGKMILLSKLFFLKFVVHGLFLYPTIILDIKEKTNINSIIMIFSSLFTFLFSYVLLFCG